ncbi:SEL1-like repeat protein [Caulobacter sp. AP07]|uniref:SEL1-like repeat protein n=1 Tax=Caulobacter sp. AP07 TaxID=1144304 RepID=UPI000308DFCA|nr:hypothetical protein [Caulobacter sp. AP07]
MTACASPMTSFGIDLRPGAATSELQSLAERSRAGDKQAQLALGIRLEHGDGVARDVPQAIKLYRRAATKTGGKSIIYAPASRTGGRGASVLLDQGPESPGLPEAARRLEQLKASGAAGRGNGG